MKTRTAVIAVPFAWLVFAALMPFLIVLRLSFAEMDPAGVPHLASIAVHPRARGRVFGGCTPAVGE